MYQAHEVGADKDESLDSSTNPLRLFF